MSARFACTRRVMKLTPAAAISSSASPPRTRRGTGIESAVSGPSLRATRVMKPSFLSLGAPPEGSLGPPPAGRHHRRPSADVAVVLPDRGLERACQILAQRPVDDLVFRDRLQGLAVAMHLVRVVDPAVDVPVVDQRRGALALDPRLRLVYTRETDESGNGNDEEKGA